MANKTSRKLNIWVIIATIVVGIIFIGVFYLIFADNQSRPKVVPAPLLNASSDKSISSFTFDQLDPVVNGVINQDNHTVELTVPYGTDLTNLTPTIQVSASASVSPASNVAENFTHTIIYTVTAADGTHQDYTTDITVSHKPIQAITDFSLGGQVGNTLINQDAHTISLTVPSGTDVSQVAPDVSLIAGATISPTADVAQDFTKPVSYVVNTADGLKQTYVVTVTISK